MKKKVIIGVSVALGVLVIALGIFLLIQNKPIHTDPTKDNEQDNLGQVTLTEEEGMEMIKQIYEDPNADYSQKELVDGQYLRVTLPSKTQSDQTVIYELDLKTGVVKLQEGISVPADEG